MPSLRHASAATALARPRCRHFTRSGRTWPSSQVRTLMTLLSVSILCCRRWCSLTMTPTTRREPLRSSSVASPRSTSKSLARSSLCWTSPRCQSKRRLVASRSSMAMNHNLSQGLSPSAESYISLENSGRPIRVMGRRGSPLPRRAAASATSRGRRAEAPRPGREDMPSVAPVEAPPITRSQHETTSITTMISLAIGPRSVDNHDVARPTSHRWRRRSQLCSWHTQTTLMSRGHKPSSVMAPTTTRLTGGASTPTPPITWPVNGSSSLSLTLMSEAPSSLGTPSVWR
jgi:hypothetical protein